MCVGSDQRSAVRGGIVVDLDSDWTTDRLDRDYLHHATIVQPQKKLKTLSRKRGRRGRSFPYLSLLISPSLSPKEGLVVEKLLGCSSFLEIALCVRVSVYFGLEARIEIGSDWEVRHRSRRKSRYI